MDPSSPGRPPPTLKAGESDGAVVTTEMISNTPAFEAVEKALRRRTFGTLSTVTREGRPHATGVVYAVSPPGEPLCFYVTTDARNKKIDNVRSHADAAFVVPLFRPVLTMAPPACIQFQGTAEVVDAADEGALAAFRSTWFGRTILKTEHHIVAGDGQLCFIRIKPGPVMFTYGFGMSLLALRRRAGQGAARVLVPEERRGA
jgi:hypothetical protein